MTREEAILKLKTIEEPQAGNRYRDKENFHIEADDVLCELLKSLGYGDVVEAWEAIDKWYA